jgi:hypothetical protein
MATTRSRGHEPGLRLCRRRIHVTGRVYAGVVLVASTMAVTRTGAVAHRTSRARPDAAGLSATRLRDATDLLNRYVSQHRIAGSCGRPQACRPLTRRGNAHLSRRYRIIAATSGFSVSTSCGDTLTKIGDGEVRSANVIAPFPLEQKTCSTPPTRTVTMMFSAGPRNRTR